jgi:YfiH family protein
MNISFMVGDNEENVRVNRALFFSAAGFPQDSGAFPGQIHSSTVRVATAPGNYPETDALVTDIPGITLCVTIADCVPILLFDPTRKCLAAVHAGWRGTAGKILENTVAAMRDRFGTDPADLKAFIGPAGSVCCYEVGEEVSGQFDPAFVRAGGGRPHLDLKAANRAQLRACSVPDAGIDTHPSCTICEVDHFHSYRRDGIRSGRMMACIALIPP